MISSKKKHSRWSCSIINGGDPVRARHVDPNPTWGMVRFVYLNRPEVKEKWDRRCVWVFVRKSKRKPDEDQLRWGCHLLIRRLCSTEAVPSLAVECHRYGRKGQSGRERWKRLPTGSGGDISSLAACMSLIDNDLSGPIGKIKHFCGAINPKLN